MNALDLISELRASAKIIDDNFGDVELLKTNVKKQCPGILDAEIGGFIDVFWDTITGIDFVRNVIFLKTAHIANGIEWAIKNQNILVSLQLTRSLVEHCGSMAILLRISKQAEDALRKCADFDKGKAQLYLSLGKLNRLYSGTKAYPEQAKPYHSNDLIKALSGDHQNISKIYDYLSEYVHPNYGSNKLVSSGEFTSGEVFFQKIGFANEANMVDAITIKLLSWIMNVSDEISARNAQLNEKFTAKSNWSANPQVILAKRSTKHSGDGKTPETAIIFIRARSKIEEMELLYEYLYAEGIDPKTRQLVMQNDRAYDVFSNGGNKVWVGYSQK